MAMDLCYGNWIVTGCLLLANSQQPVTKKGPISTFHFLVENLYSQTSSQHSGQVQDQIKAEKK